MSRLFILITALFFTCMQAGRAQSFTTSNDTIYAEVSTCPGFGFFATNVINPSSSPLPLNWRVVGSSFPAEWLPHFDVSFYGSFQTNSALDLWDGTTGSTYSSTTNPLSTTAFVMLMNLEGVPLSGTYWVEIAITDPASSYSKNIWFMATRTTAVIPPDAGYIVGDTSVCVSTAITLSPSNAGGIWHLSNSNATLLGSGGMVHLIGTIPGIDTVFYTVTDACGSDSTYKIVTVNATVDTGIISGPDIVCAGSSITLSNPVPGGIWSSANSLATVSGGVVSATAIGVDTIYYSVNNSCGTAAASHIITIGTPPDPGTIMSPYRICPGEVDNIEGTLNSGGVWTASNNNASVSGFFLTGITEGLDTLSYTVSSSCGSASVILIATVNPIPVPTITMSGGVLHAPSTFTSYQWKLNGINISGAYSPDYTPTVNGIYSVAVSDALLCNGSASFTLNDLSAHTIAASNNSPVIYPNPNTGTFTVRTAAMQQQEAEIVITDISGRKIKTFNYLSGNSITLSPGLETGIYILSVHTANGNAVSRLIIN